MAVDLSGIRISGVWLALGGGELKFGRAPAFWRKTSDRNVSLNDAKGTWYDFRDSVGGGVLGLVQHVRGGTRADAYRWLAERFGLPVDQHEMSAAEKREWRRRWNVAEAEARKLIVWRDDLLSVLREYRDQLQQTTLAAQRWGLAHIADPRYDDDPRWELCWWASTTLQPRVDDLDARIDVLATAQWKDLLPYFRAARAQSVAA